jgi:prephenate dehydrogenase
MNIGIIGLGLIGGSIARAIKHETADTVMGMDINETVIYKAKLLEAIDAELNDERLGICDYLIVALYNNASIILVPPQGAPIELLEQLKKFWGAIGFTNLEITTAVRHDKIIAYTSQLAHVASSAFVKSETALAHKGFSAGSYKDLTRVARLNEVMWAELFLENRENLLRETTELIEALQKYEDALKNNDEEVLMQLLKEGRLRKEQADRNDMK